MIIVVFDNEEVPAATLAQLLSALGHTATHFSDEAKFREHICTLAHDDCDVAIINAGGPQLTNRRLISDTGRYCPRAKIICSSGYGAAAEKIRSLGVRIDGFVGKPYAIEQLRMAIQAKLIAA